MPNPDMVGGAIGGGVIMGIGVLSLALDIKNKGALKTLIDDLTGFAEQIQKAYVKVDSTIETATTATATAIGSVNAALKSLVKPSIDVAARTQVLSTVMHNVGKTAKITSAEMDKEVNAIKKLGITTQEASGSATRFVQAQLNLNKASQLARAAQDLAVIAGENSSETYAKLTESVASLNTMTLNQYGLLKNLGGILGEYAAENKRTVSSLTEREAKEAMLNYILKESTKVAGSYENAMQDVGKMLTSIPRLAEEAYNAIGKEFLEGYKRVIKAIKDSLEWFNNLDDTTKKNIINFGKWFVILGSATTAIILLTKANGGLLGTMWKIASTVLTVIFVITTLKYVLDLLSIIILGKTTGAFLGLAKAIKGAALAMGTFMATSGIGIGGKIGGALTTFGTGIYLIGAGIAASALRIATANTQGRVFTQIFAEIGLLLGTIGKKLGTAGGGLLKFSKSILDTTTAGKGFFDILFGIGTAASPVITRLLVMGTAYTAVAMAAITLIKYLKEIKKGEDEALKIVKENNKIFQERYELMQKLSKEIRWYNDTLLTTNRTEKENTFLKNANATEIEKYIQKLKQEKQIEQAEQAKINKALKEYIELKVLEKTTEKIKSKAKYIVPGYGLGQGDETAEADKRASILHKIMKEMIKKSEENTEENKKVADRIHEWRRAEKLSTEQLKNMYAGIAEGGAVGDVDKSIEKIMGNLEKRKKAWFVGYREEVEKSRTELDKLTNDAQKNMQSLASFAAGMRTYLKQERAKDIEKIAAETSSAFRQINIYDTMFSMGGPNAESQLSRKRADAEKKLKILIEDFKKRGLEGLVTPLPGKTLVESMYERMETYGCETLGEEFEDYRSKFSEVMQATTEINQIEQSKQFEATQDYLQSRLKLEENNINKLKVIRDTFDTNEFTSLEKRLKANEDYYNQLVAHTKKYSSNIEEEIRLNEIARQQTEDKFRMTIGYITQTLALQQQFREALVSSFPDIGAVSGLGGKSSSAITQSMEAMGLRINKITRPSVEQMAEVLKKMGEEANQAGGKIDGLKKKINDYDMALAMLSETYNGAYKIDMKYTDRVEKIAKLKEERAKIERELKTIIDSSNISEERALQLIEEMAKPGGVEKVWKSLKDINAVRKESIPIVDAYIAQEKKYVQVMREEAEIRKTIADAAKRGQIEGIQAEIAARKEKIAKLEKEVAKYFYEVGPLGNWGTIGNKIFKNYGEKA